MIVLPFFGQTDHTHHRLRDPNIIIFNYFLANREIVRKVLFCQDTKVVDSVGLSLDDMMFLTAKGLKASILGLTGDKTGTKRSRESEKIGAWL